MPTETTTTHLLTTPPFATALHLATRSAFLRAAGHGHISTPLLAAYLTQDRLYQHAYVRFVASMLAKLRFDSPASANPLYRKIMNALIDALNGIRTELALFERVAAKYGGFSLTTPMPPATEAGPTSITRAYVDFFASVAGPSASLLEGLVALWGTEMCYLEAWRWASTFTDSAGASKTFERDADGGAIRGELMPSWTSEAFGDVVAAMAELVDEVAEAEGQSVGPEVVQRRCEEVWRQILWLEERFWPVVEGEG